MHEYSFTSVVRTADILRGLLKFNELAYSGRIKVLTVMTCYRYITSATILPRVRGRAKFMQTCRETLLRVMPLIPIHYEAEIHQFCNLMGISPVPLEPEDVTRVYMPPYLIMYHYTVDSVKIVNGLCYLIEDSISPESKSTANSILRAYLHCEPHALSRFDWPPLAKRLARPADP